MSAWLGSSFPTFAWGPSRAGGCTSRRTCLVLLSFPLSSCVFVFSLFLSRTLTSVRSVRRLVFALEERHDLLRHAADHLPGGVDQVPRGLGLDARERHGGGRRRRGGEGEGRRREETTRAHSSAARHAHRKKRKKRKARAHATADTPFFWGEGRSQTSTSLHVLLGLGLGLTAICVVKDLSGRLRPVSTTKVQESYSY